MFRVLLASVLALAFARVCRRPAFAEDKAKKETLKGTDHLPEMRPRNCDKCGTVIKVGEKLYWFDAASNKKYHKDICKAGKEGTVTGTVKKEGDKMVISVTKLEYK